MDQHDAVEGEGHLSIRLSIRHSIWWSATMVLQLSLAYPGASGGTFEGSDPMRIQDFQIPWLHAVPEVLCSIILDTLKINSLKYYNHSTPRIPLPPLPLPPLPLRRVEGERERRALPPKTCMCGGGMSGCFGLALFAMADPADPLGLFMTRELRVACS